MLESSDTIWSLVQTVFLERKKKEAKYDLLELRRIGFLMLLLACGRVLGIDDDTGNFIFGFVVNIPSSAWYVVEL